MHGFVRAELVLYGAEGWMEELHKQSKSGIEVHFARL